MSQNTAIKDTDIGYSKIRKLIADITKTEVKAGWFEKGKNTNRKSKGNIKNNHLAIIHEYGVEKKGKVIIPERPFAGPSFKRNKQNYEKIINNTISGTWHKNDISYFNESVKKIGLKVKQDQQTEIRKLKTPRLKDATIKRKGSSKLLIDTGQLLNSNEFQVIKKK